MFYSTKKETIDAANEAKKNDDETDIKIGNVQCDCGESFAVFLIDKNTLNKLEEFICCPVCNLHY